LRIVRVSEYVTPSPGGREVHVRELCLRQALRGHAVRLIYRVGGESDWPFSARSLLRGARIGSLPRSVISSLFLLIAVADVARNRRTTDVAHFHGDYLEALAAGAARLLGVPSLLTLHGRLSPRVLRTVGFIYRLPSHIVAVSPMIANQLAEVGVPRKRVTIQPSGVDAEIFYPAPQPPDGPPFRVVVASALIPLKDHATLFAAVLLLQEEGLDVQLEVAGVGPEREHLECLAPSGTRFHGQLERSALGPLLRSCHVAALASVDVVHAGEGTPTFLMEAIACGLPFVATDAGGVPRLASLSRAGVVVPQHARDQFAAALRVLMRDSRLYELYRRAALDFGPSLDWDGVSQRLDSVLVSMVRCRSRSVGASSAGGDG
jgi:glycosyltransferase involved in cell wall biosynthesis